MSAFLTGAVFSLPELYVNYKMTGFAIPGARFLDIYEKVFHHQPTPGNVLLTAAAGFVAIFLILLPLLGWLFRKKYCKGIFCGILILGITFLCIKILWGEVHTDQKYSLPEFFEDIFRGQYSYCLSRYSKTKKFVFFLKKIFIYHRKCRPNLHRFVQPSVPHRLSFHDVFYVLFSALQAIQSFRLSPDQHTSWTGGFYRDYLPPCI